MGELDPDDLEHLARGPEHSPLHNVVGDDPTEDELATALTAWEPDLRFCDALGGWQVWDGHRYVRDSTLHVWDRIRAMTRAVASRHGTPDPKLKKRLGGKATIVAVEALARSNRHYAVGADQFDADIWALNTPAGLVDLSTQACMPATPGDLVTRVTAAGPGGDCPLWLAFLSTVTGQDEALAAYLQRLAGYCLTGSTQEHAFAFFYGTGGNGKSVFLNTLQGIWGDYAKVAPFETFTAGIHDKHPTELARLRGARLVIAQETERGRRWAESRIKSLTSGDPQPARFMHKDFFEYVPQFKLLLSGNHKPALSSVDEAMQRRLHLVPFTVTIPAEQCDPELPQKLRAEWPGILRWALDGLADYLQHGLQPPAAVLDATREYFEGEDAFGTWLQECCEQGVQAWEQSGALFTSWAEWASKNGYTIGNQNMLAAELKAKGFESHRSGPRGRHWVGLKLREKWQARAAVA